MPLGDALATRRSRQISWWYRRHCLARLLDSPDPTEHADGQRLDPSPSGCRSEATRKRWCSQPLREFIQVKLAKSRTPKVDRELGR